MQQEIIELLEKEKKAFTLNEIASRLLEPGQDTDHQKQNVSKALKNLIEYREIQYVEIDRFVAKEITNLTKPRRMRLYFIK